MLEKNLAKMHLGILVILHDNIYIEQIANSLLVLTPKKLVV